MSELNESSVEGPVASELLYGDAAAERLDQWCLEDHTPVTISMDRMTLFAVIKTLHQAGACLHIPERCEQLMAGVLRDLESLCPDDIRRLAGRVPYELDVAGKCECGRPLTTLESRETGECEVCLDSSTVRLEGR